VLAFLGGNVSHRPGPASADVLPPNCGPTIGTAAASVRIESVPANPRDGDILAYKVGASYPAPANGVGCTVFDVDVFIKLPGSHTFQFVCNIPSLASGSGTVECDDAANYVVSGADRTGGGNLIATVHVMGNKHDRPADCVFGESPRHPTMIDPCFDASAISLLAEADTPTPTSTSTDTPVATATPLPADTPTPVVDVLSEGGSSRAVPAQLTLPDTGTRGEGTTPRWIIAVLLLAGAGSALASTGRLVRKPRSS
jgi:hypothetical protein